MSVRIHSVVSTMLKVGGADIVREETGIPSNLGLPLHETRQLYYRYNRLEISSYHLFREILHRWLSYNGKDANIGRLTNILKDMKQYEVAEAISKLGNSQSKIIPIDSTKQAQTSTSNNMTSSNPKTFSHDVKQRERLSRAEKWKQYKVDEFLGSGSFGFVFKIHKDPETIPSAAKIVVISPESNLPSDAGTCEVVQANRELQAMQGLSHHQNVVQLLNYDVLYPTSVNVLEHYGDAVKLREMLQSSTSRQMQRVLGEYSTCVNLSSTCRTVFIEMELCGPNFERILFRLFSKHVMPH